MKSYKTIVIPAELHKELKLYCARNGYNLTNVVSSALGNVIAISQRVSNEEPRMEVQEKTSDLVYEPVEDIA